MRRIATGSLALRIFALFSVLNSSRSALEPLVAEIHATNHAWKLAQTWGDSFRVLANSLADRKASLQTRLLRTHPDRAYLQRDREAETQAGEPLFGVQIVVSSGKPSDAAHLPVRVAQRYLSEDEIAMFSREGTIVPDSEPPTDHPSPSAEP